MEAKKDKKLEQLRALVREQGQITGFSYPFCELMLLKLKELLALDRVFKEGFKKATKEEEKGYHSKLTPIAISIIEHLKDQLVERGTILGPSVDCALPKKVSLLISTTEEFLSIFEEES